MAKHVIRRFCAGLIALLLVAVWVTPAIADVTISLAPSLVEAEATPGGQGAQDLTIFNDGNEPFVAVAAVKQYKDGAGDRSAVDWLKVEPRSVELAPGGRATVRVTISVPAGLESGGRYAMVAFTTAAKSVGTGAGVSAQLGVPFLVTVKSGAAVTRQASLDRLLPVLETDGKVGFRGLLVNRGNAHIASRGGIVEVARPDGTPVGRLAFPESTSILPQSQELLVASGTLPLQPNARYEVRGDIRLTASQAAKSSSTFTARPGLSASGLSAAENFDRGPSLRLGLRNEGEMGLVPRVQFDLRDGAGQLVGSATPSRPALLWPGETSVFEALYPGRLLNGDYKLVSRTDYGIGSPLLNEAAFQVGTPALPPSPNWGAAPERARQPATSPIRLDWLLLAVGSAALILVFMLGGAFSRLPVFADFRRRSLRAMRARRGTD